MPAEPDDPRIRHLHEQLDPIDLEIVRQASVCGLHLRTREQMRADLLRVLQNDATVCPHAPAQAFQLLRAAVTMHLTVRHRAIETIGREETQAVIDEIAARLAARLGLRPAGN